jgi:hypothetical protein
MRTFLRAALAALALALWQAPLAAETVQGTVRVGNRTIALPPGTWTKIVETVGQESYAAAGPPSNALNIGALYARTSAGRLTGLVSVRATRDPSSQFSGFLLLPQCQRTDLYFVMARSHYQHDQDCVFVSHTRDAVGGERSQYADEARPAVAKAGLIPPTWLSILTRRADQVHFLSVIYFLAPEAAGFPADSQPWRQNGWHPDYLDPARRAYMERIKTWAELAQEQTRLSFRNRPVTPLPEP